MLEKILQYIDPLITKEQKDDFREYYPAKIFKTERNIAIIVAATQLFMIVLFLLNPGALFTQGKDDGYFLLYMSLLVVTLGFLPLYAYAAEKKKFPVFNLLRRVYVFLLCCWLIGITALEFQRGAGINIYCYLLPTLAAVMIWTPLESLMVFGGNWIILILLLIAMGGNEVKLFSDIVNSLIVAVLALFISNRYYQSMAVEFRDRQIIEEQYQEIQGANELLNQMAYTDQLTGMYNRRYLAETVFPNFETYQKNGLWGEILMVDIDHFKNYNDSFGHLQGDKCLRQVSKTILAVCEEKEVIPIRYGGEEFLLVNIKAEHEMLESLAQILQNEVREILIPRGQSDADRITVSIGVWYDSLQNVDMIEKAIRFADKALYQAKDAGRNCICYYNGDKN